MDPVAAHAASRPDHPALIADGTTRTYRALDERAARLARGLAGLGVGAGERVALMLPNGAEWFEVNLAVARLGAQLVPVNWHLRLAELAWILADSDARVLVTAPELAASVPNPGAGGFETIWLGAGYENLLAAADPIPDSATGSIAPALVLYTSGTTGRPKGVVHEQDTTARSRTTHVDLWGFTPDDVHFLAGPAYHGAPWSYAVTHLALGATVVTTRRWDAAEFLARVEQHRVTNTFVVPTHLARLIQLPPAVWESRDPSSLRLVLHGGAACPIALKERVLTRFGATAVWEFYGFSEGGRVTRIGPNEWRTHPGSVGRPLPGVSVAILDDDGAEVPPGETGWIYVAPADGARFAYRNDPAATAAVQRPTRGGTAVTGGDLGHLDRDGYLYVTDRSVDLVVRGGVNVYPREVEEVLAAHPDVADCTVFGVPDPDYGEGLRALVEPVTGATVTPADLEAHCRERLARFKVPEVRLVAALPRDPNGKVRKGLLRAAARAAASAG